MIKQSFESTSKLEPLFGTYQTFLLNFMSDWGKKEIDAYIARNRVGANINNFEFNARFFFELFEQYQLEHSKAFGACYTPAVYTIDIPDTSIPDLTLKTEIDVSINPSNDIWERLVTGAEIMRLGKLLPYYKTESFKVHSLFVTSSDFTCVSVPGGGFYFESDTLANHTIKVSVKDLWNREVFFNFKFNLI